MRLKKSVTPSVTTRGDTNLSDATQRLVIKSDILFGFTSTAVTYDAMTKSTGSCPRPRYDL